MAQPVLAARVRLSKGKGAARTLRQNNQIPAIFYGPKIEPVMLAVDYPELNDIIKKGFGENTIIDLQVHSEHGTETHKVMLKEILSDPIKDTCLHVDFYEISMDKEITVPVPIRLINTPIGVTDGGILQHIKRELTISCLPDKLIESLDVDVSSFQIGDSLHVDDIELPEGTRAAEEGNLTVAIVAAPTVVPEAAEEEVEEEAVEEEEAASGAEAEEEA